jgi:hypothetical protein
MRIWATTAIFQLGSNIMGERPAHVKPPAYLSKSPPVPMPEQPARATEHGGKDELEPTRYGDWERKGIAWDF